MERLSRLLSEEENLKNFGGKKAAPFKKEEGPSTKVVSSNYFRAVLKQVKIDDPDGQRRRISIRRSGRWAQRSTPVVDVMIEMDGSEGIPGDVEDEAKTIEGVLKKFDALIEKDLI